MFHLDGFIESDVLLHLYFKRVGQLMNMSYFFYFILYEHEYTTIKFFL